jgi:hypothetical protein
MTFGVRYMWLLFVEAGVALFLLIFIVWWTMFSGRKPDQPPREKATPPEDDTPDKR